MQSGQRPIAVGLFFSLGHSTVVILAAVLVALGAGAFAGSLGALRSTGSLIGTLVSAGFLLMIALLNLLVLASIVAALRRARAGPTEQPAELPELLAQRGLLTQLCRPLFRFITQSWHMYPLGVLFGLGFDTATEIAVVGLSATQASNGLALTSTLLFPLLFAAGMSLIDTLDSTLMLGVYGWALIDPVRKLRYNLGITGLSVLIALVIAAIELLGLARQRLNFGGALWRAASALTEHFAVLGYVIVGLFLLCWLIAAGLARVSRAGGVEAQH
jgi:high-affinity nickel-transport protein